MARRGGQVIGIDPTPNQLETAQRLGKEHGLGVEFIEFLVKNYRFLNQLLILRYLSTEPLYGQTLTSGFQRQQES